MKRNIAIALVLCSTFHVNAQELKTKFNWYNLDYEQDGVRGMSTERAYKELLKGRQSTTVIVGVIDSGVDIEHEDLKRVIWQNTDEVSGNQKDDDNNGFTDDLVGWDFIGGADGTDVDQEQLESARLLVKYDKLFGDNPKKRVIKKNKEAFNQYKKIQKEVKEKKAEAEQYLPMYEGLLENFTASEKILKEFLSKESLTTAAVEGIVDGSADLSVRQAKQFWLRMTSLGATATDIKDGVDHFRSQVNYNYNLDFNARTIVGDNPDKLEYGTYGNNEVKGPDAMHGTHVSGIIAGDRTNNIGIMGVADNAKILVVRTVPNGDERDKDVANAIRYAADNGAQIINMSFGKAYSPEKKWVDDAVKYATEKGVLFIAAAGNDNQDVDEMPQYPTKTYLKGGQSDSWITVGALDFQEAPNLPAEFSNYGQKSVDVFAPGVAIYSTVPGNRYEEKQGTSMAAPAVAGVAALLKSYFPDLTAVQIKDIILKSVVNLADVEVTLPGDDKLVKFGTLSSTGGVVNAYNAVKMALEMTGK